MVEGFAVSLRNQPVRRGLVAGFAVALFGSLLALGCVQGPKGAFERVWGTDGVASKATKSLKSIVRREDEVDPETAEKLNLVDKKNHSKKSRGEILQASTTKSGSDEKEKSGRSWIKKPAQLASSLSNGIIAAPFVKKRNPNESDVQDPFLAEISPQQIAKSSTPAKRPAAASGARPGNAFAPGFNTQMAQLNAEASRDRAAATMLAQANSAKANAAKAQAAQQALAQARSQAIANMKEGPRPKTPETKAESPELVALRKDVAELMRQARAADQHGHLNRAMELALSADALAQSKGLKMAPNDNRPEDLLQRLREKQFAFEHSSKSASLLASAPVVTPHAESILQGQKRMVEGEGIDRKEAAPRNETSVNVVSREFEEGPALGSIRHADELKEDLVHAIAPQPRSAVANGQRRTPSHSIHRANPESLTGLFPEGGWQPAEFEDRQPQAPRQIQELPPAIPMPVASTGEMIVDTNAIHWRFPPRPRFIPDVVRKNEVNFTKNARPAPVSTPGAAPSAAPKVALAVGTTETTPPNAKASSNRGARLASYTARVQSNRGTAVNSIRPASGDTSSRRDPVVEKESHGSLIPSAQWVPVDGDKSSARGHILKGVTLTKEPGLLVSGDDSSIAQSTTEEAVEELSVSSEAEPSSSSIKKPLGGRSFATVLGIAVAFVIGIALLKRFRMTGIAR